MTQIIYQNDGRGNIQVLPIAETDMPAQDDYPGWKEFYRDLTARYGSSDRVERSEFLGKANATLYHSAANYWAVFGLDIRPGLDDHTIRFVRFAYRDTQNKTRWPALAHPPMAMAPDIARDCVAGWEEINSMPAF